MKKLYILTTIFPYGISEPYLSEELEYISGYDEINIISLSPRRESSHRKIREEINVYPIFFRGYIFYLLYSILVLFDPFFYKEISKLQKEKKLSLLKIKRLFIYLSRANYEVRKVKNLLLRNEKDDEIYFYSYRLEYQAFILAKIKKEYPKIVAVSRAHGYDLYEEANSLNYIPLHWYILETIDKIFPVSLYGERYLKTKFEAQNSKISTRYLGTADYGYKEDSLKEDRVVRLVSCSNAYPGKRIDRIISTLSNIRRDFPIIWTHFGDGSELSKLKDMSRNLPANVTVSFRGFVANDKIIGEYLEGNFDYFISVSESEGIPVSMMEALSVGLPIISTNVGGVPEIVQDKKEGYLIEKDFQDEELIKIIEKLYVQREEDYQNLCINSRKKWAALFDSKKNYTDFYEELLKLKNGE